MIVRIQKGAIAQRSRVVYGGTARHLHASFRQPEALKLAFEKHEGKQASQSSSSAPQAVVLCHGLFGSKQNWRTIGRAIAKQLNIPVYAVDLRNHGQSPHAASMSYTEMAQDLKRFFVDHEIRQAALVGHSMGGKAVMAMALDAADDKEELISHLISVDMTPARGPLSAEFAQYIKAMIEIEEAKCQTRQEADKILEKTEPDLGIRQFLLTNLTRASDAQHWTFRIPIHTIQNVLAKQVGDFPFDDEKGIASDGANRPTATFTAPTLFLKGERSKYINRKNVPLCDAFFPNAIHKTLATGHWVQAEKPQEFIQELTSFVAKQD